VLLASQKGNPAGLTPQGCGDFKSLLSSPAIFNILSDIAKQRGPLANAQDARRFDSGRVPVASHKAIYDEIVRPKQLRLLQIAFCTSVVD